MASPLIQLTHLGSKEVQSLVLCPTRELCLQIASDIESYAKYVKGLKVLPVYGGTDIYKQIKTLQSGVHIVVGTPGRVIDLIGRGELKINKIRHFVLDEADEMLNMGFKDDIDAIEEATPLEKQTLLFSATMPDSIREIAKNYMIQPDEIEVGTLNSGAENVTHEYYQVFSKKPVQGIKTDRRCEPEDLLYRFLPDPAGNPGSGG